MCASNCVSNILFVNVLNKKKDADNAMQFAISQLKICISRSCSSCANGMEYQRLECQFYRDVRTVVSLQFFQNTEFQQSLWFRCGLHPRKIQQHTNYQFS